MPFEIQMSIFQIHQFNIKITSVSLDRGNEVPGESFQNVLFTFCHAVLMNEECCN